MCGIAGMIGPLERKSVQRVKSMLGALQHRGPDQHGLWCSSDFGKGAVLGHRRLSIIDLSDAGRQPMVHRDTGVAISYNGECYNYVDLRRELEAHGHRFHSRSDTEVILNAYVQWGEKAFEHLRGMFALIIWDPRTCSAVAVRDRMGIKPLYYVADSDGVLMASEVRALMLARPDLGRLDPQALSAYLWQGFVPGPKTIVSGIQLLPPGSLLRVADDGRIEHQKRYWRIPSPSYGADAGMAIATAAEELQTAVQLRLVSDVPLGVFLSGGVDSSVIATLAQRCSPEPVQTFNIGFEDRDFDESEYARRVATALGTEHHEIPLTEDTFRRQLPAALDALDQPTFDGINTYFVSRAVREAGLTVALSGAGGDELFGGYSSFRDLTIAHRVAPLVKILPMRSRRSAGNAIARLLAGPGSEVPPQTRWGKLADILATGGDPVSIYQCSYALFTSELHQDLMTLPSDGTAWGLYPERYEELSREVSGLDTLPAVSHLEMSSFLGERLLRDTDTASMAVSLEARVPLLDHRFIEAVSRLPLTERYQPLGKKKFLRNLMSPEIPAAVFDRPKAGFVLPLELWCRRSLLPEIEETIQDLNLANSLGLNCETLSRVWRAFRKGSPGLYWSRIWALFVFMRWCRRYNIYA